MSQKNVEVARNNDTSDGEISFFNDSAFEIASKFEKLKLEKKNWYKIFKY